MVTQKRLPPAERPTALRTATPRAPALGFGCLKGGNRSFGFDSIRDTDTIEFDSTRDLLILSESIASEILILYSSMVSALSDTIGFDSIRISDAIETDSI